MDGTEKALKRPWPVTRSRGMALIAVLWLLMVLSVLAATVATLSSSLRRETTGSAALDRLELAADSAIRLSLLKVIAAPRTQQSTLNLESQYTLFDNTVSIEIELENGRIDLNAADPNLLFAFFRANGWTDSRAHELVTHIGERDAPFEAVEQLRQLPGAEQLTPKLLDCFTVYTHTAIPAEQVAPQPVKAALAWADAHELGDHPWHRDSSDQPMQQHNAGDLVGQILRVHACARRLSIERCREAVVRPVGQSNEPFQVFVWRSHPWG